MAVTRGGGDEGEGACPAPAPPRGPAQSPPGIEVPFLVSNNTKWISGIVEATSCGDIIKALLAAEGRLKGITEEQLERFVLVERWRRVERPLKKDSCLLKIWQAWGPEARDVQFILKRVSCKKVSRPRTKVKRTNSKLIKQLADLEQKHPKYAGSDSDSEVVNMQGNIQVSSGLHTLIVLFNLLATKTTNHLSTDIPSQSLIMLFKILFTTDLFSLVYDYVNLDQIFINECQNRPPPLPPPIHGSCVQALLKIIIQQRETIQTQLGNLKAKDLYLKTLDKSLSCSDGREYVLRNYLEQIPEHGEVGPQSAPPEY